MYQHFVNLINVCETLHLKSVLSFFLYKSHEIWYLLKEIVENSDICLLKCPIFTTTPTFWPNLSCLVLSYLFFGPYWHQFYAIFTSSTEINWQDMTYSKAIISIPNNVPFQNNKSAKWLKQNVFDVSSPFVKLFVGGQIIGETCAIPVS